MCVGAGLLLAMATAAANSPMEQCAVQWRDLEAAGKTVGQDYRAYAAACLKANAPPPAVAPVQPKGAAKPARTASGKVKRPNRMSLCAAQWRQMKAQNTTRGMTYRQWSSQCLSSK